MICKICKKDKKQSEFRKNKHGYVQTCNDCRKPRKSTKTDLATYRPPNGQGGKWDFNFKKLSLNNPEANYIYGLMVSIGKTNPNIRKFKNFWMVSSNKKVLDQIAAFLEMDAKAVYEMPRAVELKLKSKWGLMLYHPEIVEQIKIMESFRREEFKKGKLEGVKYV